MMARGRKPKSLERLERRAVAMWGAWYMEEGFDDESDRLFFADH